MQLSWLKFEEQQNFDIWWRCGRRGNDKMNRLKYKMIHSPKWTHNCIATVTLLANLFGYGLTAKLMRQTNLNGYPAHSFNLLFFRKSGNWERNWKHWKSSVSLKSRLNGYVVVLSEKVGKKLNTISGHPLTFNWPFAFWISRRSS